MKRAIETLVLSASLLISAAVISSCTANADEGGSKVRNQGCYNQIDTFLVDKPKPVETFLYNSDRYLVIQHWFDSSNGGFDIYSFNFDRLNDVCDVVQE